jgi:hypothetical protein
LPAVAIGPRDRAGLERLCRYLCRPALAKSRLDRRADGQVVLNMKRAWSDGTAAMVFSPGEQAARSSSVVWSGVGASIPRSFRREPSSPSEEKQYSIGSATTGVVDAGEDRTDPQVPGI